MQISKDRVKLSGNTSEGKGPVVYWMSREQRVDDNWALLHAQDLAIEKKKALVVVFCLIPSFLDATIRAYDFMLKGLKKIEKKLSDRNIQFLILTGDPSIQIPVFLETHKSCCVISDFDPLKIKQHWKNEVISKISIPFYEVDSHNIVPCLITSSKQEYAARTIRPKINRLLGTFLINIPKIKQHPFKIACIKTNNWKDIYGSLKIDHSVPILKNIEPGEIEARKKLAFFIENNLDDYNKLSNDPCKNVVSNLSPYLHFGHISSQRVALEVMKSDSCKNSKDSFLEELIIRKELSDNFCYHNKNYDTIEGFPNWAKQTLQEHARDEREYLYNINDFESGKTHDMLWNAAQMEMVATGKMHGFMRMYWAKKILEWTKSPQEALKIAIYLNDKFSIDGRDPNGYTGIAWSIGGVHDRAWKERPVFGKIRYMSYKSTRKKFDVDKYIKTYF